MIDLAKLPIGTKIEVHTKNSTYLFESTDKKYFFWCQGGSHLPERKMVNLLNSFIKKDMQITMFITSKRYLTTSQVQSAKIIGSNWEYQMEWA